MVNLLCHKANSNNNMANNIFNKAHNNNIAKTFKYSEMQLVKLNYQFTLKDFHLALQTK